MGYFKYSSGLLSRLVLLLAALFFSYDIIDDLFEIYTGKFDELWHMAIEAFVFVATITALVFEQFCHWRIANELKKNEKTLLELTGRFAEKIKHQFDIWQLTRSEQEVAWLILKGYSFIEIGSIRNVREKTIRQQAGSIYSKTSTGSRAEFSAFFLEDIIADTAGNLVQ